MIWARVSSRGIKMVCFDLRMRINQGKVLVLDLYLQSTKIQPNAGEYE